MAQGFKLPAYEINNALINMAPINNAIDDYRRREQQGVENERQNKLLGFKERELGISESRLGMDQAKAGRDAEQARVEKIGREAGMIDSLDGPQRQQMHQRLMQGNPDVAAMLGRYGMDPNDHVNVPKFLMAQAGSYDPLGTKAKQAQIAQAQAATAASVGANSRANALAPFQLEQAQIQAQSARRDFENPPQNLQKIGENDRLVRVGRRPDEPATVVVEAGDKGNKADAKFAETAAIEHAKRLGSEVEHAVTQQRAKVQIGELARLSERIGDTGIGNTAAQYLGPMAKRLGLDGAAFGRMGDREAFETIVNRLVPQQRPPGSGTMSDADLALFKASLPQLSTTIEGRRQILQAMDAITNYDIQRGQIANSMLQGGILRSEGQRRLDTLPNPLASLREAVATPAPGATAPVKVQSPAEAQRLPPGTPFVTPDGRIRVRR